VSRVGKKPIRKAELGSDQLITVSGGDDEVILGE
jgi:hypothetical protein